MTEVPKPFFRESPSVLRVKEGGGCLSVFGIPFFLAGCWMLVVASGVMPIKNQREIEGVSAVLMALMGALFFCFGGAMVFGRRWMVFDKIRRHFILEYGFLFPIKRKVFPLTDFNKVILLLRQGDSDSADRYFARLSSVQGEVSHDIASSLNYGEARNQAIYLSSFLHIPMEDITTSSSPSSSRYSDQVEKQGVSRSDNPVSERSCVVSITRQGVEVVVPMQGAKIFHVVLSFVPALIIFSFLKGAFTRETLNYHKVENAFTLFFIGFVCLFFVVIPVVSTIRRYQRLKTGVWRANVTSSEMTIDYSGGGGDESYRLPLSDILAIETSTVSVEVSPSPLPQSPRLRRGLSQMMQKRNALIVKTKHDLYTFPLGLPDGEMAYIRSSLASKIPGIKPAGETA